MIEALVRTALAARARPGVVALERRLRSAFPPLGRAAKRAYARYKRQRLVEACADPALLAAMRSGAPLPHGWGRGMDERIVEYPWALAHLPPGEGLVLDAGSTLNQEWIADHPALAGRPVLLYTLAPEGVIERRSYSYVYGDLRRLLLRDGCASAAVCISTLEHVGMDNTAYTGDVADAERRPGDWRTVLREIRRVLAPGSPLLLTVPFGRRQDLGWLQQFDAASLREAQDAFGAPAETAHYFRHDAATGWRRSTAGACADAEFLDVRDDAGRSVATMATAIACLVLRAPLEDASAQGAQVPVTT